MKDRLTSWPTTVLGLGILAFVAVLLIHHPELIQHTELLLAIAGGVAGILMRTSK